MKLYLLSFFGGFGINLNMTRTFNFLLIYFYLCICKKEPIFRKKKKEPNQIFWESICLLGLVKCKLIFYFLFLVKERAYQS